MNETRTDDKIYLLRLAFKGLGDDELEEVASLTKFRTYPSNHILCHEGAYEDVLYIIAEGQIVISQKMIEGQEDRIHRGRRCRCQRDGGAAQECRCSDGDDRLFHSSLPIVWMLVKLLPQPHE